LGKTSYITPSWFRSPRRTFLGIFGVAEATEKNFVVRENEKLIRLIVAVYWHLI